jgi:hypothetical protein
MDGLLGYLETPNFKKQIKGIIQPIGKMIYNEMFFYIWFICIYNVFLIFLVMANLFLLIRLLKQQPNILSNAHGS